MGIVKHAIMDFKGDFKPGEIAKYDKKEVEILEYIDYYGVAKVKILETGEEVEVDIIELMEENDYII